MIAKLEVRGNRDPAADITAAIGMKREVDGLTLQADLANLVCRNVSRSDQQALAGHDSRG